MGEIKSTLEIALEKAKAVEISSEDRERFKHEAIHSKARDLFQRYTSHGDRSISLSEAIKKIGKDASLLEECVIERFLEALDPYNPSETIWAGLSELGLENPNPFRDTLSRLAEENARGRREAAEDIRKMVRDSLVKEGISGTAIDPNIEENTHWKDISKALDQEVSAGLDGLRQEVSHATKRRNSSAR